MAAMAQVLGIEAARRTIMQEIKVTSRGNESLPYRRIGAGASGASGAMVI